MHLNADFFSVRLSAVFPPIGAVFPVLSPVIPAILPVKVLINKKRGRFSLSFLFPASKIAFPAARAKDKTIYAHCRPLWMGGSAADMMSPPAEGVVAVATDEIIEGENGLLFSLCGVG